MSVTNSNTYTSFNLPTSDKRELSLSGSHTSLASELIYEEIGDVGNHLDIMDPRRNKNLGEYKLLENPNSPYADLSDDTFKFEQLGKRTKVQKCKDWFIHNFLNRLSTRDQWKLQASLSFTDMIRSDVVKNWSHMDQTSQNSIVNYVMQEATQNRIVVEAISPNVECVRHVMTNADSMGKRVHGITSMDVRRANDTIDTLRARGVNKFVFDQF